MLTNPLAKYAHIRQINGLYYLAGQGCRDPETNQYAGVERDTSGKVTSYDIAAQTNGVLRNIERVLQSQGLSRADLIDVNVFLVSMDDFPKMNAVWNEFFANVTNPPTRTTVAVAALPGDNFVEMKAIAAKPY
jgi:2-iminobutanoate/2-iminopropanoate deaminase